MGTRAPRAALPGPASRHRWLHRDLVGALAKGPATSHAKRRVGTLRSSPERCRRRESSNPRRQSGPSSPTRSWSRSEPSEVGTRRQTAEEPLYRRRSGSALSLPRLPVSDSDPQIRAYCELDSSEFTISARSFSNGSRLFGNASALSAKASSIKRSAFSV